MHPQSIVGGALEMPFCIVLYISSKLTAATPFLSFHDTKITSFSLKYCNGWLYSMQANVQKLLL